MVYLDFIKIKEMSNADILIAQALGRDVSIDNYEYNLEAYQYGDHVYIVDLKNK
jgi:hypothetical protein